MKILLMLGIILNVAVSAKVLPYNPDKNSGQFKTNALFNFRNQPTTSISEIDIKVSSVLLTSHLLFDSFKTHHPLLIYGLSGEPGNILYIHKPLIPSGKKNPANNQFILVNNNLFNRIGTDVENSGYKIYWNKRELPSYIYRKLPNIYLSSGSETEPGEYNTDYFNYAGSKRFTLDGESPKLNTEIIPMRASLMGAIALTTAIALHINQSAAWWDGKGTSFYFYDDWNDALFADKFGHFLGGYFTSYFTREAFVFSGFSWDESILLGSLAGLISQTYIEFKDGYAENTGFSASDLAADALGVVYFYLQHYLPVLQNFSPKWQYVPPGTIGVPPKARTQTFLDNYNSTTAWISVHVRNLFRGREESFWPRWLNIGLGYGISGYYTPDIHSRFVIGIDYNLVELLPDGFPLWNWLKQSLNCIKFPAPAIEFSRDGTRFRFLYPFSFSIGSIQF
jgi:hypothetical protein